MRLLLLLGGLSLLAACSDTSSLRSDQPLLPVKEYERLIVGRLDADYVGNAGCLAKCHKHDRILKNFDISVHGEQIDAASGLPLVNCESCHGPGSLAIEHAEVKGRCDFSMLLPIRELPAPARSLICLKCHSTVSTSNLQHWNSSPHATSDVSCSDCHKLHLGPQQKVSAREMAELCFGCHLDIRQDFAQSSHHGIPEDKMACTDCHNPHGSVQDHLLNGNTVKETCTRCHMQYQGPFVFEHADLNENCIQCHRPHGAPNDPLLAVPQPALCLQCHAGHFDSFMAPSLGSSAGSDSAAFKKGFFGRCTDCHSSIHGSDIPSYSGKGSFLAR